MANKLRGEIEIEIEGKTYQLAPSFEGICEVEEKAGIGVPAIYLKVIRGQAGIRETAAIIYGGLIGAECFEFSFKQIGNLVMKHGIGRYGISAGKLIAAMATPESVNEERKKIFEEKKTVPPEESATG